jgi:putative ABC transport system substrate-binding protein
MTCSFMPSAPLVQLVASTRLPAVYFTKDVADAGGLIAYGSNLGDSYRRAATYVDKILKGASLPTFPSTSQRASSW